MSDPTYVRLVNRMTSGIVADLSSGWSISGYDVRRFPDEEEDPQAAAYVRSQLRRGTVEPASKAEWDEVHEEAVGEEMLRQDPDFVQNSGIQEARLQRAARAGTKKIQARREGDEDTEDEERRERILAARKGRGRSSGSSKKKSSSKKDEEGDDGSGDGSGDDGKGE